MWRPRDVLIPAGPRVRSGLTACDGCSRPSRVGDESRRAQIRTCARVDPTVATGLLLTLGVAIVLVGTFCFGVLFWMIRHNAGLARLDRGLATWAGDHATDLSTSVLRVITQLGSTPGVIVVAVVVALIEYRRVPTRMLPVFLVLVIAGQNFISNVVKVLVDRARPDIHPLAPALTARRSRAGTRPRPPRPTRRARC